MANKWQFNNSFEENKNENDKAKKLKRGCEMIDVNTQHCFGDEKLYAVFNSSVSRLLKIRLS